MIEFRPGWRSSINDQEREEINAICKTMIAVYEEVEHTTVTASWIATFADMAWAVWKERKND